MSEGAVALITGAAGDIGRATAFVLADRGWRLALTDHPRAADELARTSNMGWNPASQRTTVAQTNAAVVAELTAASVG